MEYRGCTPSVIATLMGLDALPSPQPIHCQQRVLSENYLQRTSSIGVREKRFSNQGHLFRMNIDIEQEVEDVNKVLKVPMRTRKAHLSNVDMEFIRQKCVNANYIEPRKKCQNSVELCDAFEMFDAGNLQQSHSMFTNHLEDLQGTSSRSQRITVLKSYTSPSSTGYEKRCMYRGIRKHPNLINLDKELKSFHLTDSFGIPDAGYSDSDQLLRFHLKSESRECLSGPKIVVLKPNGARPQNTSKILSCSRDLSLSSIRKHTVSPSSRTTELLTKYGHASVKRFLPNGQDAKSGTLFYNIKDRNGWMNWHRKNIRSKPLPLYYRIPKPHGGKYFTEMEALKQKQMQLRMKNDIDSLVHEDSMSDIESMDLNSANDCTIRETSVPAQEAKKETRKESSFKHNIVVLKTLPPAGTRSSCSSSIHSRAIIHDDIPKFEMDLPENFLAVTDSSASTVATTAVVESEADAENSEMDIVNRIHNKQLFDSTECIELAEDHKSSHTLDDFIQQEASNENVISDSVSPVSPRCSDDTSQPSPVSVLKLSSNEGRPIDIRCLQGVSASIHEIRTQLQKLTTESLQEYSEGPGMIVSSDDNNEQDSSMGLEDGESMRTFSGKDSRDFSYLADLLDEAGVNSGDLGITRKTWYSQECPIDPKVFEAIEKKYGLQTSWNKSERRLLFDRIIIGLVEILRPCIDLHKKPSSVKKRVISWWRRGVIEEELWAFLVNQEKEACKESAALPLGKEMKWLDLVEDIDGIVIELEKFLIDELVAEFVIAESFWST